MFIMALMETSKQRLGLNEISFVALGFLLSSLSTLLTRRCLTKKLTSVVKPKSLAAFSTDSYLNVLNCD